MKDMLEMHVSYERKERMAKMGIVLLKELDKVYKHYKLAFHLPQPVVVLSPETDAEPAPSKEKNQVPHPANPDTQQVISKL